VRPEHHPHEPRPDGLRRLSLVRQFERKEEMRAYPLDLERLPNGRPQLPYWPVIVGLAESAIRGDMASSLGRETPKTTGVPRGCSGRIVGDA